MSWWKDPTTKDAYVLSWISTFLTAIFAISGVILYTINKSSMCLVFGLENLVDVLSSLVVLWRFWASGNITKEREKTLKRREIRASMAISIILMILGMGVIATSSYDIARGPETNEQMETVLAMAGLSIVVCLGLTVFKFHYSEKLGSESLYKDGVCSLIGTIMSVGLLTNTLVILKKPNLWWLDPMVAMICGFTALFIGLHTLFIAWKVRRVPIFSLSWWLMSRGDGRLPSMPVDGDRKKKKTKNPIKRIKKKLTPKKLQRPSTEVEEGDLELKETIETTKGMPTTETTQSSTNLSEGIV